MDTSNANHKQRVNVYRIAVIFFLFLMIMSHETRPSEVLSFCFKGELVIDYSLYEINILFINTSA